MALCLLRTGDAKGGYMEIALDPAVNRTGQPCYPAPLMLDLSIMQAVHGGE
jgi:hypothetical protein